MRPDGYKYLNERNYEILGSGGFMLVDNVNGINEIFQDKKESVVYSSIGGLIDKVKHYLTNEKERIEIAKNGYERAKKWTYDDFVGVVLDDYRKHKEILVV